MSEQLNLFENGEFIFGINLLNELKWENGLKVLKKAKPLVEADKLFLQKAKEIGEYWQTKLSVFKQSENTQEAFKELLHCYKKYDFPKRLNGVKQNLLLYMVAWMIKKDYFDHDVVVEIFSLLKAEKKYSQAVGLMKAFLEEYPKAFKNYYLLAQAEWLNGQSVNSKKHYLQAFLYYPDQSMLQYVANKEFRKLAEEYPLEKIPAYAWLYGKSSFVSIEDDIFSPFNENHDNAYNAYKLLKQCHLVIRDGKKRLYYRKKLQKIAPQLLQDYLNKKVR